MILNTCGLLLNFLGSVILLAFGFPAQEYTAEGARKLPRSVLVPENWGKVKYWLARIGSVFLIVGFALQLIAAFSDSM